MEHYNLLLIEKEGLKVIRTSAYANLIQSNPGLIHDNWGDFYSPVEVGELSDIIYQALEKDSMGEKANKNMVIVGAEFPLAAMESEKDYLIKEAEGVRIYSPSLHTPKVTHASQLYSWLGLIFIEDLFTEEKIGTLQTSMKEFAEQFIELEERLKASQNSDKAAGTE